jgi:hypothetical protein
MEDNEHFIGADRQTLVIRLYGERTKHRIRFDLDDMFSAFRANQRNPDLASIQPSVARICGANVTIERKVVDMWQFFELIVHFNRHGNENAKLVYDWVIDVVFAAQYGDGIAVRQADHAAGVGDTLPSEFGKDLCGSYAYSFLEGSASVIEAFPCLADKIRELDIADEPWSLWKNGHTEHMRGRLQSADVKEMLAIHPDARISRGHFTHVPAKLLAAKVETSVRTNTISQYRVHLPEHPSMTELFVLPASKEDWLREEGQTTATKILAQAIDKTELSTLKLECKHRDELAKLRDDKDAEIAKLREEKLKIAHTAARMLCPKKKLATLDSMFQT